MRRPYFPQDTNAPCPLLRVFDVVIDRADQHGGCGHCVWSASAHIDDDVALSAHRAPALTVLGLAYPGGQQDRGGDSVRIGNHGNLRVVVRIAIGVGNR